MPDKPYEDVEIEGHLIDSLNDALRSWTTS